MSIKSLTTGVQHIGIPTKNLPATKDFFKKLDFQELLETFHDGTKKVAFMKLHNLMIEAYETEEATGKVGAIDHIAIDVKDIEAVHKHVTELGLNPTNEVIHSLPFWDNGIKYFTIKGPNEEKVEFSQIL